MELLDYFMVYVDSFNACLENLSKVLTRCIDTNLVLNFEKCHFMVTGGIVLGHLVSNRGIEVDKSKIDIITSLPNPTFMQEVHSFLGHAGFYSKIALPLSKLLQKDVEFKFDLPFVEAFQELKNRLASAPILQAPNWDYPFKLLCDTSNSALRAEFNIEIRDKKGAEISIADHLSRIKRESDPMPIQDVFLDEQLLQFNTPTPWFVDICNFVAASRFPPEASWLYKERHKSDAKYYIWDDPYLWRLYNDQVIRRCILDAEINLVLQFCHAASGGDHYGLTQTSRKVLDCVFCWSTIFIDAYQFVSTCEKCQKAGITLSRRHEIPQQPILFCEVFDIWGIDFMGPFLVVTFVTEPCPPYSTSIEWCIELPQPTTPRKMAKLKYSIGKSRKHCKRWPIPARKTRADSMKTLYGHTELRTELRWGCLPTGLSLIKPIIS
ncbi:Retrovirus-related Pol polyprotein, partial [Mucuna pruriens]